jgi:serine/threonine protein kinase
MHLKSNLEEISILLPAPDTFLGMEIGGINVREWLGSTNESHWFHGVDDSGSDSIVYLFESGDALDSQRARIHGYKTRGTHHTGNSGESYTYAVGQYRYTMPADLREQLTGPQSRPSQIGKYEIQEVLGYGYVGVTYKVKRISGTGMLYALKVVPADFYKASSPLPEAELVNSLANEERDLFPSIHEIDTESFQYGEKSVQLIYSIQDLLPGETLERFIANSHGLLTAQFLSEFVKQILFAHSRIQKKGLVHDDLHAGNILVHPTPIGLRVFIIDFGNAKKPDQSSKQPDDIRTLALHLANLTNLVQARSGMSAADERIVASCQGLISRMIDDDPLRRPEDSEELLNSFASNTWPNQITQLLKTPFDFGNAEELLDNKLLKNLSSKQFPWFDRIESSSHVLVIGPRGCGKTTVFRSLSFSCNADAGLLGEAISKPYVGLYISCTKEFRQKFSTLSAERLRSRHAELRHYFNLLIAREATIALKALIVGDLLNQTEISQYTAFLEERLHISKLALSQGITQLQSLESQIVHELLRTRDSINSREPLSEVSDQSFVSDLADFFRDVLIAFAGKVLFLFIDDYTEKKVPAEAQRALNPILFVPNSSFKCKISSEVFGVVFDESLGNFLDQDRDYKEWNLGTLYYLELPSAAQKDFVADIVDTRLRICDYAFTVKDLVGLSNYNTGRLSTDLRAESDFRRNVTNPEGQVTDELPDDYEVEKATREQGHKTHYHGWDTICELCSGDISNILEVLRRIFEKAGITPNSSIRTVEPSKQHAVIHSYSQSHLAKIKAIPGIGDDLFSMVEAFGSMAGQLLREYPMMNVDQNRKEPYRVLRIELDEASVRGAQEKLEREAIGRPDSLERSMTIWRALQRYCIFIDGSQSRSRRNTLSDKVLLRRIFCPAFNLALSHRESLTLSKAQWDNFCADPKGFAQRHVREVIDSAEKKRASLQLPLFPEEP